MLVLVLALLLGVVLPPLAMWLYDMHVCTDVERCDNCPIHTLTNTSKVCKDSGKLCKDIHYCSTRKWLQVGKRFI